MGWVGGKHVVCGQRSLGGCGERELLLCCVPTRARAPACNSCTLRAGSGVAQWTDLDTSHVMRHQLRVEPSSQPHQQTDPPPRSRTFMNDQPG
eukprot:2841979-Rhodomonas_salina.1